MPINLTAYIRPQYPKLAKFVESVTSVCRNGYTLATWFNFAESRCDASIGNAAIADAMRGSLDNYAKFTRFQRFAFSWERIMKNMRRLIRTTVLGGIIFLIPLVFVVVVFGKAISIIQSVAIPLGEMIPVESVAGVAIVPILTTVILFASCLLAGMLARSSGGQKVYRKLDTVLLQMIPGYAWIKGITGEVLDEDADEVLKPVLVTFDDQSQLAFEVDRGADGWVAIYIPGAPDPRSGTVSYVTSDRVQSVDIGFKAVTKICKNLGRESTAMLPGARQQA